MDVDEILKKYGKKIDEQVNTDRNTVVTENFSKDYLQFKSEMAPELSKYEDWCKSLGNSVKIKLADKDQEKIQKNLDSAHLDVEPGQAVSLAFFASLIVFFAGFLLTMAIYFIFGNFSLLMLFLVFIASIFLFYYFYSMPSRLANQWRLKAGSQMVPCILYVVVYMRHTSNLERAIRFAAQHLSAPLSLDFKKIFWDVETGRFSTIKESLDHYLETWRGHSMEFIESFHLIESSLFEPGDERRIATLERALQVILDGVYEKMLKYSREIRSPLTNLYMLGIILPTLGLALLPLASTLLNSESTVFQWYHVVVLFDLIIPFFVFYLTSEILLKRPGGHGEASILELNPLYPKYKSKKPYYNAFLLCFPLLLIGLLPFIFQFTPLPELIGLQKDYTFGDIGFSSLSKMKFFDFRVIEGNGKVVGPFGPVAVLLSLFVPLSFALFFSTAYSKKTKELIKTREQSKDLEKEFTSSLFQLGNRLGDGLPAEMAFAKVAESSRGTATEDFFKIVNVNLHQAGMSLEESIFNERRGALVYYPSSLIRMCMKILVESVKKGLQIAAVSLMSISQYIKNIDKINERLRDLLAEIVSDMKSNMTFLAPLLAGIVVGLATMISVILSILDAMMKEMGAEGLSASAGINIPDLLMMFSVEKMISPYFMQLAIGIYIIEIIFILTGTLVTVDVGEDKLKKMYDTASNLKIGAILYIITAFIAVAVLSALAGMVLQNALG